MISHGELCLGSHPQSPGLSAAAPELLSKERKQPKSYPGHLEVSNWRISVSSPEKTMQIPVLLLQFHHPIHLSDVCCQCDGEGAEPEKDLV